MARIARSSARVPRRPSRERLKTLIREAKEARSVSDDTWTRELKPQLAKLPGRASPATRALLALYNDPDVELGAAASIGLRDALNASGYPVPVSALRSPALAKSERAQNVSEPDHAFNRLARLVGRDKAQMLVAVVDTGFELSHPALRGKLDMADSHDFVTDRASPAPHFHGQGVLGIATGGTKQIQAMALRAQPDTVVDDAERVARVVDYAASKGARVVNLSFRADNAATTSALLAAIARHPQMLFVKSAGNSAARLGEGEYAPDLFLSANVLDNMVVVAAAKPDGSKAAFSNFGVPYVNVGARGTEVDSTALEGGYVGAPMACDGPTLEGCDGAGTSFATPDVSNVASKALLLDPALTPPLLKRLIADTVDARTDWKGVVTSGGLLNHARAYRLAALTGLVRGGQSAERAAKRLGLVEPERGLLLGLLPRYLPR